MPELQSQLGKPGIGLWDVVKGQRLARELPPDLESHALEVAYSRGKVVLSSGTFFSPSSASSKARTFSMGAREIRNVKALNSLLGDPSSLKYQATTR